MPLTQYPITGSLRDALDTGPQVHGTLLFVPYGSHDSRVEDDNVLLGPIRENIVDLDDPYLLDEGSWTVTISTTHKPDGRYAFKPITVSWQHDSATTWADIISGVVTDVPVTPTLLQQAEDAAEAAEADAAAAAASAASVNREQASGVAGLTSAGKLYEIRIPDRLTDSSPDRSYALKSAQVAAFQRKPIPTRKSTTRTMIQAHASGHGWTAMAVANTLSTEMNDTSTYLLGRQSAKIVTATTALDTGFKRTALTPIDFTGCDVRVRFKFDDWNKLGVVYVMLYNSDGTSFQSAPSLIDLTSGAANTSAFQAGEWITLDIPWSRFTSTGGTFSRSAVTEARVYIRGKSGQSATVNLSSVEAVPQNEKGAWPNGALILTLDDCWDGQATLGIPYLDKYGDRCTLFPIKDDITASKFPTSDLQRFRDMGHEVGAHASSTAVHTSGLLGLTTAQVVTEMEALRQWQIDNDFSSLSYAYPLGQWNPATAAIVSRYFESARLAAEGGFHETARPANPYALRSIQGGSTVTAATITAEMDKAKASKGGLFVMYHQFVASGATGPNQTNIAAFQTVVDYAHTIGMPIVTQGEFMAKAAG